MRVLIVEDEPLTARLHQLFIERAPGFVVSEVATTVEQAIQALARGEVDLVLLDVILPDGSGMSVLRYLRVEQGSALDVIAVTADDSLDSINAARMFGVVHYLVKPFSAGELWSRLEAVRQARDAAQGADRVTGQQAVDRVVSAGLLSAPDSSAAAEAAEEPDVVVGQNPVDGLYRQALRVIEVEAAHETCSPITLAETLHVSVRQLQRAFARAGVRPQDAIRERRTRVAEQFLLEAELRPIEAIAELSGFGSAASLRRAFHLAHGCSPLE